MKDKQKREKRLNLIGLACGLFVLIVGITTGVIKNMPATAGMKDSEIPASAQHLTGTAQGRNGDVTVEIVADDGMIYRINVVDHQETDGIGTKAVEALPAAIFQEQSLKVDAVSGATLTSDAIKNAIVAALQNGNIQPGNFGGALVKLETVAKKVETHSGVTVMHAADWAEQYPNQYETWAMTSESSEAEDYLELYPMLRTLYEGYGFAKDYKAARGHWYDVEDIEATGRPHPLANCWTCKTPDFTNMVNEMGIEAYKLEWTDAANLACGQCHNEYYFAPDTKATSIAHNSIASMAPDQMLAFFNDGSNFSTGEPFVDWTNPRTGVKQIKVQHPEFETFLGEGSQHRGNYTCADCHMPTMTAEDGTTFHSHNLISPLDNPELIENECSKCHADLVKEVKATQERIEARTYSVGYELEFLTEQLAAAVESGKYTDAELDPIRSLARDAQFYWDFVFVENAEGAHNPVLTDQCLDSAEALCNQAINSFRAIKK